MFQQFGIKRENITSVDLWKRHVSERLFFHIEVPQVKIICSGRGLQFDVVIHVDLEHKMYFDVAKHLYDVSVMFDLKQIQEMIQNQQIFLEMLGYKRLEETRRTGSDLAEKKFSDFQLLRGFSDNEALRKDYQNMQRNYVFAEEDTLSFDFVVEQWKKLGEVLLALE